jgi:hypothetical protein
MSKLPKLSLKSIVAASVSSHVQPETDMIHFGAQATQPAPKPHGTLKERAKQLSVYLEPSVHDQLRDIAYSERTKIHPLMLEALDLLFKKRGALSIKQLASRAQRM